jgi:hypothetical protein
MDEENPDDGNKKERGKEPSRKQPQPLKSLANFMTRSKPLESDEKTQFEFSEPTHTTFMESGGLINTDNESELQNSNATFVDVNSDLAEIFGYSNSPVNSGAVLSLEDLKTNFVNYDVTMLRSTHDELSAENDRLRLEINLLTLEKEKNSTYSEDVNRLKDELKDLKLELKEKDEQVGLPSIIEL